MLPLLLELLFRNFSVHIFQWSLVQFSDSYKMGLGRRREFSKSASSASKTPPCRYYNQLSLLQNAVTNRRTISNVILLAMPHKSTRISSAAPSITSYSSLCISIRAVRERLMQDCKHCRMRNVNGDKEKHKYILKKSKLKVTSSMNARFFK